MIFDQTVDVTISNNGSYFEPLLGYKPKQRQVISIDWKLLPSNSNKLVAFACDDCGSLGKRSIQMLNKRFDKSGKHSCRACSILVVTEKNTSNGVYKTLGSLSSKRTGDKHPKWNPNKVAFNEYHYKVQQEQRRWDLELVPGYDKAKRGLCGAEGAYQLDHIVSVKEGFDNDVDPYVIGHICNLQFIPWEINRHKWSNSEMTINQLKNLVFKCDQCVAFEEVEGA